jgi:hypothetical protein
MKLLLGHGSFVLAVFEYYVHSQPEERAEGTLLPAWIDWSSLQPYRNQSFNAVAGGSSSSRGAAAPGGRACRRSLAAALTFIETHLLGTGNDSRTQGGAAAQS